MDLLHATEFFATARERYQIKLNREKGQPWPWTADPVFQEWRFCNVHRENDKTTIWFRVNVREPIMRHSYDSLDKAALRLVEGTIIFRWFNRIETGEIIKDLLLEGWDRAEARRRLENVRPLVTGAYMIKTLTDFNKLDGILESVDVARRMVPSMIPTWGNSLEEAWEDLKEIPYLGPFMSYEVISDLRWTPILDKATDIMTWANFGPGGTHGMGRVISGNPKQYNRGSATHQAEIRLAMIQLLEMSKIPMYWPQHWPKWDARTVEHWSCEFDKYCRATLGERMKRKYP